MLARSGQRFTLVTVAGGLMVFLIKTENWLTFGAGTGWTKKALAAICAAALVVIWCRFQFLIDRLGAGIARVEHRINALTDDVDLLRWETDHESQRTESPLKKALALRPFWR